MALGALVCVHPVPLYTHLSVSAFPWGMCIISTAAPKGLLWVRVELPGDAEGDLSTHDGKGSGHEGRRIWSRRGATG